jgi:hypothetical protein
VVVDDFAVEAVGLEEEAALLSVPEVPHLVVMYSDTGRSLHLLRPRCR